MVLECAFHGVAMVDTAGGTSRNTELSSFSGEELRLAFFISRRLPR